MGPASQADLGRSTSVDRGDVVGVLNELEDAASSSAPVDPGNRRRNIVSITRAGKAELEALDQVIAAIQERVIAPLSSSERRTFAKLLRRVAEAS